MSSKEFEERFDVLYNNITSNLAPGINTYEKCIFLTKAEKEIIKNHLSPNSVGNTLKEGFDDSAKRLADFSCLMATTKYEPYTITSDIIAEVDGTDIYLIDDRSSIFEFPKDVFIPINEVVTVEEGLRKLQIVPLKYSDYTLLMSKPYKRPLKNQAWRLFNSGISSENYTKYIEVIAGPNDKITEYIIRYIRVPKPIIIGSLDGLTIDGYRYKGDKTGYDNPDNIPEADGCELDPILHEEILLRAVELAKIAWAGGQEELAQTQLQITSGQRSE